MRFGANDSYELRTLIGIEIPTENWKPEAAIQTNGNNSPELVRLDRGFVQNKTITNLPTGP